MILRRLKLRARAVFARRRVERDLDQELAFHIERETRKHLANGISPAEARCVSYSTISSFGTRSRPARARVSGDLTTRFRRASPRRSKVESKCSEWVVEGALVIIFRFQFNVVLMRRCWRWR